MKRFDPRATLLPIALATLVAIAAIRTETQASDFATQLSSGIRSVQGFEYGQDPKALEAFEKLILRTSPATTERAQAETSLLTALDSASPAGSDFICRLLRTVASDRSIPQLETLLTNPALSHKARYALERLESHKASAALHRALGKTSGDLRAGILGTLGRRGYRKAVPEAVESLRSSDPALANAAATALGQLGGDVAITALRKTRAGASPALQRTIDDALLASAERLLATGDPNSAIEIYADFDTAGRPVHHRVAALRGLVAAGTGDATERIFGAIRGLDPELRATAIRFTRDLQGEDATLALVALLPKLDAESQKLLLESLSERKHPVAALAILTATRSDEEAVRVAAYRAMGKAHDASVVDALLGAARGNAEPERRAARASLVQLRGDGVDARLLAGLATLEPSQQIERLQALASRQSHEAFGTALTLAWSTNADVRVAAIAASGNLATGDELPILVALAVSPRSSADRMHVAEAIQRVFRRVPEAYARAAPLLAALPGSSGEAKTLLLGLLVKTGTPEAALAMRRAVNDGDPRVRGAAIHGLAQWPDATPARDLLTIAAALDDRAHKSVALKGYLRMASHSEDTSGMYRRVMALANNRANTQVVLESLATVTSDETLTLAEGYLDAEDAAVKTSAARSVVRIASGLRDKDAPRVKSALSRALAEVDDDGVRRDAQEVLNHFEQYEGYLLEWLVSGPYRERGKHSYAVYDKAFLPEQPNAQNVPWKPLRKGIGAWALDLGEGVADLDHVAAYLKTRIHSPVAQPARIELGSDDAVKAWINNELVHSQHTRRGLVARDDIVEVQLKQGWNEILLKAVDHGGSWMVCCRLRKPDGTALEGIEVKRR